MFQNLGDGAKRQDLYYLTKYVLGRKAKLVNRGSEMVFGFSSKLIFLKKSCFFFLFFFTGHRDQFLGVEVNSLFGTQISWYKI